MKNRNLLTEPEINFVRFHASDVITASTPMDTTTPNTVSGYSEVAKGVGTLAGGGGIGQPLQ